MNAALLLGLLLMGQVSSTAPELEEIAEERTFPAGLYTGPLVALVAGVPALLTGACCCLAGPGVCLASAGAMWALPGIYILGSLGLVLAAGAPLGGCVLVGLDLMGFQLGQRVVSAFNNDGARKATLTDVGNNHVPLPTSRLLQGKGNTRLRDAAVGAGLAMPSMLALVAALVLMPLSCALACRAYLIGGGAAPARGIFLSGWLFAVAVVGAAGVWWLLSAAVVRPLLLMALDAPPS